MQVRKRWIVSIAAGAVVALALSGIALAGGSSSGAGKTAVGPWGRGVVSSHPSSATKPSGAKGISYFIVAVTQQSAFIDADDSGSATPGDYTVFTDALYDLRGDDAVIFRSGRKAELIVIPARKQAGQRGLTRVASEQPVHGC